MDGLTKGPGMGGQDPNDIFAQFFAHPGMFGFDFGPGRPRKGEDTMIPYEATLEDIYNGKTVKMNMEKEAICSTCKG